MDKTLYLTYDDDSYELIVDTNIRCIREIWRYRGNQRVKPEIVQISDCDERLRDQIDDLVLRNGSRP